MRSVNRRLFLIVMALPLAALLFVSAPASSSPSSSSSRMSSRLAARMREARPGEEIVAWVFLREPARSGTELMRALDMRMTELAPRALQRRRRARGPGAPLVDRRDLPLTPSYLRELERSGASIRARSRWLNAVSVQATPEVLTALAGLSFVSHLDRVAVRSIRQPGADHPLRSSPERVPSYRSRLDDMDYGVSWGQNDQLQVPQLHEMGLTGDGILVAVLDTGFDLTHEALVHLKVVDEWDFIHGDSITRDEPGQDLPGQDSHGTMVLSVLAGYLPGLLIGPAYGAEFLLAKTEREGSELPVEEDWWVEAIEWAEARGVDVVSSSVGYFYFDDEPDASYGYEDMDGDTAVTTIAADRAASLGVFVASAIGNEAATLYPYPLAPADGDSVAAVGSVDMNGDRSSFSSFGPTYDGRIKPDLQALGREATCADPSRPGAVTTESGTSFATPLVAGVAALLLERLLEIEPTYWTGPLLLDTLRQTATRSDSPDTLSGWGIVQAARVLGLDGMDGEDQRLVRASPNPFQGQTEIRFTLPVNLPTDVFWKLAAFDVRGRRVRSLDQGAGGVGTPQIFSWDGRAGGGRALPSGLYFIVLEAGSYRETAKIILLR